MKQYFYQEYIKFKLEIIDKFQLTPDYKSSQIIEEFYKIMLLDKINISLI